jgi:hypothetical protein
MFQWVTPRLQNFFRSSWPFLHKANVRWQQQRTLQANRAASLASLMLEKREAAFDAASFVSRLGFGALSAG